MARRRRRRRRRMSPAAIAASRKNLVKARAARASKGSSPITSSNYARTIANIAKTGTPKARAAARRHMGIKTPTSGSGTGLTSAYRYLPKTKRKPNVVGAKLTRSISGHVRPPKIPKGPVRGYKGRIVKGSKGVTPQNYYAVVQKAIKMGVRPPHDPVSASVPRSAFKMPTTMHSTSGKRVKR